MATTKKTAAKTGDIITDPKLNAAEISGQLSEDQMNTLMLQQGAAAQQAAIKAETRAAQQDAIDLTLDEARDALDDKIVECESETKKARDSLVASETELSNLRNAFVKDKVAAFTFFDEMAATIKKVGGSTEATNGSDWDDDNGIVTIYHHLEVKSDPDAYRGDSCTFNKDQEYKSPGVVKSALKTYDKLSNTWETLQTETNSWRVKRDNLHTQKTKLELGLKRKEREADGTLDQLGSLSKDLMNRLGL